MAEMILKFDNRLKNQKKGKELMEQVRKNKRHKMNIIIFLFFFFILRKNKIALIWAENNGAQYIESHLTITNSIEWFRIPYDGLFFYYYLIFIIFIKKLFFLLIKKRSK